MRILQIHNDYKIFGGESKVVENEKDLLTKYGQKVAQFIISNSNIDHYNLSKKVSLLKNIIYSNESYNKINSLIRHFKPNVIHIHNVFPLISPSAYYTAYDNQIPVVQTIHNFRFLCPNGLFLRKNKICELCKNGNYFHAFKYHCYKNSFIFSGLYSASLKYHHAKRTFFDKIDNMITLSEFSRQKFIEVGFDPQKISLKPNFISNIEQIKYPAQKKDYFLFIGRLSSGKGIYTIINAAKILLDIKIIIIGDGEERVRLESLISNFNLKNIELLGFKDGSEKIAFIRAAKALLFPSIGYENFPITILEAFAMETPVIASEIGSLPQIIKNKNTGLLFDPGDVEDLAAKMEWAWTHSKRMAEMGKEARKEYERKYTAELNYKMLMDIYKTAIERPRGKSRI